MAAIAGSFGKIKFKEIIGYRIAACFSMNAGFDGEFYVYIEDRSLAATPFEQEIDVGERGAPKEDTLQITGQRTYSFADICLMNAEVGVTRSFRYRRCEFKYDVSKLDQDRPSIVLDMADDRELQEGALKEDYTYSVGGSTEQLLGFRARAAASSGNVYRFVALQTGMNNLLEKLVEAHEDRDSEGELKPPSFQINFSQANLDLNNKTTDRIIVEESYGSMTGHPSVPLEKVRDPQASGTDLIRVVELDYSVDNLLSFDANPERARRGPLSRTVQVATIAFAQGHYQSLPMT